MPESLKDVDVCCRRCGGEIDGYYMDDEKEDNWHCSECDRWSYTAKFPEWNLNNKVKENRFVLLQRKMAKMQTTTTMIGILSFCACLLTAWQFPDDLPLIASMCGVAFTILFGWYLGLVDAYRSQMDLVSGKTRRKKENG